MRSLARSRSSPSWRGNVLPAPEASGGFPRFSNSHPSGRTLARSGASWRSEAGTPTPGASELEGLGVLAEAARSSWRSSRCWPGPLARTSAHPLGCIDKSIDHTDRFLLKKIPDGGYRIPDAIRQLSSWRDCWRFWDSSSNHSPSVKFSVGVQEARRGIMN